MEVILNPNYTISIEFKSTKVESYPITIPQESNIKLLLKTLRQLGLKIQFGIITERKLINIFSNKMRKALCLKCTNSLH